MTQGKVSNGRSDDPECGVPDGGCHSADLPVAPLDQADFHPKVLDIFAETDRGITRWDFRLGIEEAAFCRQRGFAIQQNAGAEGVQGLLVRLPFDQHEIRFFHVPPRSEQPGIPDGLIAQQEKSLGIRIKTASRKRSFRKSDLCESAVCSGVCRELREHPVWLVESQEHRG